MTTTNPRMRFAYVNYLEDTLSSLTATGSATGFGTSNILTSNAMSRSLEWRPKGNFTIDATNDQLHFNGSPISITQGNYATPTALATQIQTQIDAAVGGSTCTWSASTNKFTLTSGSSAQFNFSTTTNAIWDTIGYTGSSDTATPGEADEVRIHTHESLIVDFGSARDVDFFCVFPSINTSMGVGSGSTITLKLNSINSFTSPAVSRTPTRTDKGIFEFLDSEASTQYRYAEYKFIDRENTAGPESFGHALVYFGSYTTFTDRNLARGFSRTYEDLSQPVRATSGVEHWLRLPRLQNITGGTIAALDRTNHTALTDMYEAVGNSKPFIVSLDPRVVKSESIDHLTIPARFTSFDLRHVLTDVYDVNLSMNEVV